VQTHLLTPPTFLHWFSLLSVPPGLTGQVRQAPPQTEALPQSLGPQVQHSLSVGWSAPFSPWHRLPVPHSPLVASAVPVHTLAAPQAVTLGPLLQVWPQPSFWPQPCGQLASVSVLGEQMQLPPVPPRLSWQVTVPLPPELSALQVPAEQ